MDLLTFQVHYAIARLRRIGDAQPILILASELTPYTIPRLQMRFPAYSFTLKEQGPHWLLHVDLHRD